MDTRLAEVIRRKLDYLERTLSEIAPYLQSDYIHYARQPTVRRATERLVQIIVEVIGDTSELILQAAEKPAPGSLREALSGIHDLGVFDDQLWERFNRAHVGLRNRIVHDYETLDSRILFDSAKRLHTDAQAFLKSVARYLASTDHRKSNDEP
ncbi:MAG TPA: HepT-like ribonuclease domain-containing protein [Anaerolineae bacterium]|nr:HepT-like ribonuclease domain-containing protein [Anaerolineae bacterium]